MKAIDAGKLIRRKIRKALRDGMTLGRHCYGTQLVSGRIRVHPGERVCAIGACILGMPGSTAEDAEFTSYEMKAAKKLGLTESQASQLMTGFDEGTRDTVWQRLGADIADEFLPPAGLED